VICGGNPLSGGYKAVHHEMAHDCVQPQRFLPYNDFGPHWGFAALGEKGMLGGYSADGLTDSQPAFFATNSGDPSTSNDYDNQKFANIELFMCT